MISTLKKRKSGRGKGIDIKVKKTPLRMEKPVSSPKVPPMRPIAASVVTFICGDSDQFVIVIGS